MTQDVRDATLPPHAAFPLEGAVPPEAAAASPELVAQLVGLAILFGISVVSVLCLEHLLRKPGTARWWPLRFRPASAFPQWWLSIPTALLTGLTMFLVWSMPATETIDNAPMVLIIGIVSNAIVLGIMAAGALLSIGRADRYVAAEFGHGSGRRLLAAVLAGIGVTGVGLLCSLVMVWAGYGDEHPLVKLLRNDGTPQLWALVGLTAVVVAPLVEEMQFRVILRGALARLVGRTAAIWISSVLFSLVHPPEVAVAVFPLGFTCAWIIDRTGSYLAAVAVHMVFNGTMLALLALGIG